MRDQGGVWGVPSRMSDPGALAAGPDPGACSECGEIHPRGCTGHVEDCSVCEWSSGNHVGYPCRQCGGIVRRRACRDWPIKGGTVCDDHGGSAPQVRAAAERNLLEQGATKELAKAKVRPIGDPIVALGDLAGEALAVLEVVKANTPGENPDGPWMTLLGEYLDRAGRLLAACGRLGLEQRRVTLEEDQLDLAAAVIAGVLRRAGIDPDTPQAQGWLEATYAELTP